MHQVQLSDQLYQEAARRAREAGFQSVEDYFADLVHKDASEYDPDDLDARFTPKVLKALDAAMAEGRATKFYTPEEVDAHLDKQREAWLKAQKG
jgi:hypothetical protein